MRQSLWLLALLCGLAFPTSSFGQEATRSTTIYRLSDRASQAIANAGGNLRRIQQLLGQQRAEFQIPAVPNYTLRCRLQGREIDCRLEPDGDRCPSELEVEIPNVGRATVQVDCTGPDESGNCECEVVG